MEEKIILQPVIIKCFGLGNKQLDRVEVVEAPPYVIMHLFDGDVIPAKEAGEVMADLMLNQHSFEVLEPKVEEICLLDFAAKAGWDIEKMS